MTHVIRFGMLVVAGVLCLLPPLVAQQKDERDCKDHPLFTRMPDSWIHHCKEKEFDTHDFLVDKGKKTAVEGHLWMISYYPQATLKAKPSELQIIRNFENAMAALGGKTLYKEKSRATLQLIKDGKEVWVDVTAEFTGKYGLTIVEKQAMAQHIVANADAFWNSLRATGHVAVEGIYFDTGKSTLKPESEQAIGEVARLLKNEASLKLYVVGHTDNVGGLESNMKLSQDRAEAVVQALVKGHGIAAARLKSFGAGANVAWMRWHIGGENQRRDAFLGEGGDYNNSGIWTTQFKNWEGWTNWNE